MNKLAFGLTMMIIGIGGTFLTLIILIWSIELLKKLFPLEPAQAGSTGQLFSPERIPPQWRAKIPIDRIRLRWSQRLASMQHVHATSVQKVPGERITTQRSRSPLLSSLHARMFGRSSAPSSADSAPTEEHRDQTKPS
jgi:Na+-transporting methylmalonyl-CoA/oxaloacetate decarboxylase gamma subunit